MSKPKHSPFSHQPGNRVESIDEQIYGLIYNFVTGPVALAFFFLAFAGIEWLRYYRPSRGEPIVHSIMAAIVLAYAAVRLSKVWPRVRALKVARDGEKALGQFLDALRQRGYRVFHNVAVRGVQLEHVLIGPAGVFTVEAKTENRSVKPHAPVIFEGERIRVDGCEAERHTIAHAKSHAHWLRRFLAECTGRDFEVRPVVVYAENSVEWRGPKNRSIWVVNPKWLTSFLDQEPVRLSAEDIHFASLQLSRFARRR